MIRRMVRRSVIALVIAVAATGLVACGKKGAPLPPGESDFPRPYPNPSVYTQPGAPLGTSSRNGAPEQGTTSNSTDDNEDDLGFNPGRITK
jgi:hypothetical protein